MAMVLPASQRLLLPLLRLLQLLLLPLVPLLLLLLLSLPHHQRPSLPRAKPPLLLPLQLLRRRRRRRRPLPVRLRRPHRRLLRGRPEGEGGC